MPHYFKEHGERLVELGYRIVPLPPGSKGPRIPGWQKLNLSAADVRRKAANGSSDAGIGILAATTPAIDVDVMDPGVAQQMSDEIDRIFAGQALMTRTGMAPKFLIPFRTDKPFRKITSSTYTDGKHEHRIEILGDGQQWVAYHTHPGTGKPYCWFDGVGADGIRVVAHDELPILTVDRARMVVDAFERIAAERVTKGAWTRKNAASPNLDRGSASAVDAFDAYSPPTNADVAAILARIANDDVDYDRWFTVLAAVHHETDGAGRELAYEWSCRSAKHTDERFDTTWNSLGRSPARPVTLRTLLKDIPKPKAPPKQFEVQEWGDYKQGFESIPWLIDDVIPKAEFGIIYGASGSGKTFFALDLAAKVARGDAWRGKETMQSRVVYIAAEAGAGIKKRMAAYDLHHGASHDNPGIIADVPDLQTLDHADALSQAIGTAGLVIVDTMAASQSGDENSSKDMALFIMNCKALAASTGAMVLVVHHTGKEDSRGVRGHSSLFAAADVVVEVYKGEDGNGVKIVKQKDGETGGTFGFYLHVVKVGQDQKGKAITSCVLHEMDEAPKKTSRLEDFDSAPQYAKAREYLRHLSEMTSGAPVNVELDAFFDDLEVCVKEAGGRFRRSDAARTLRTLAARGKIVVNARWIRLSGELTQTDADLAQT